MKAPQGSKVYKYFQAALKDNFSKNLKFSTPYMKAKLKVILTID